MSFISETDGKYEGHLMLNVEYKQAVLSHLKLIQGLLHIIHNADFPIAWFLRLHYYYYYYYYHHHHHHIIIVVIIIIIISLIMVFILIFLRQAMSLGNTVLQLFCCYYSWCLYR